MIDASNAEGFLEDVDLDAALIKERALADWLRTTSPVLLGFSGGVDSAYLACVAVDAIGADQVLAVIGRSASYPVEQWAAARAVADRIGLRVQEVETQELLDPRYAANPTNRCYYCKSELWNRLAVLAAGHAIRTIVDGTNADDLSDWRPGGAAGREHGVRSPLADAGLGKAEIRALSRRRGLPTWSQPSSPCLSSRLPYGTPVTAQRLSAVEGAERALRELGITGDLRVRHHGDLARIELSEHLVDAWLDADALRQLTRAVRRAGFARVALDLRGFRSGSLNVLHGVSAA
jgi:uncharacterized protein